jgi:hypothetical protein
MAPATRDRQFRIRLDETELAMLHALAERDGISASDFVRQFVRRSYAATFGEKPPKKPKS